MSWKWKVYRADKHSDTLQHVGILLGEVPTSGDVRPPYVGAVVPPPVTTAFEDSREVWGYEMEWNGEMEWNETVTRRDGRP